MKAILILALLSSSLVAAEPALEVRQLIEARDLELHRINLAYAQKLDELLVRYNAAGDTANAGIVKALIAEVERDKKPAKAKLPAGDDIGVRMDALVGKWTRDFDGGIFEFKDAESGIFNGREAFTMTYDAAKKRVTIVAATWTNTLAFTTNPDVVGGTYEKNSRSTRYRLTRMK